MASRPSRPLAAQVLRCGLLLALVGLFFAIALYFATPWIGGFPEWGIFLWPTAVMMMGLSGISDRAAALWTVAIIASNGVWYFVVGVTLAPPVILAWRLARHFRRRAGR
jgi:hypothetical protein